MSAKSKTKPISTVTARLKILGVLLAVVVVGVAAYLFLNQETQSPPAAEASTPAQPQATTPATPPPPVNQRAIFTIFTNGTIRVFTESKYHNRSADAFLTAEEPSIVQIKKAGVTWQQFFDTLPAPMKLTADCLVTGTGQRMCNGSTGTLKFYLNGQSAQGVLSQVIKDGDRLLVSYGSGEAAIPAQLQRVPSPY